MKRSKPMRRTPMKRGTSTLKTKTRMRLRSEKMAAKYAGTDDTEGRRAFVARILKERPVCEGGALIGEHLGSTKRNPMGLSFPDVGCVWIHCDVAAVDVHEVLARSAGGSILDDANVKALCRHCHDWVGNNPKAALALGLRKSRYAGRNA